MGPSDPGEELFDKVVICTSVVVAVGSFILAFVLQMPLLLAVAPICMLNTLAWIKWKDL